MFKQRDSLQIKWLLVIGWIVSNIILFLRAEAREIPWSSNSYSYIAKGEDLGEVLKNFCAAQGIPVVISKKVQGVVDGRFVNLSPHSSVITI